MSRKFLFGAIAVLVFGVLAAGLVRWFTRPQYPGPVTPAEVYSYEVEHGYAPPPRQSVPRALPWKRTVRLAIGSLGLTNGAQNGQLNDLTVAQLDGSRGLKLVERRNLEAVLREQEMSLSSLVRARDAVRAGKLLRADWFLLGTSAEIHDTNCLVIRLVDSRTGMTLDGTVLVQRPLTGLAAELADFVRQARRAAAEARPRVYLAIGAFEDLSLSTRQSGFARQLRGYLTAAYQHSRFTLLERQYADVLLREMQMDLAGLTAGSATDTPPPLQSAFWLVDGCYQSYETTNLEVEVRLEVHRIFSTTSQILLRGLPGDPVCREIKGAIDRVLNQNTALVMPTRRSEVREQMFAGKRLAGVADPWGPAEATFVNYRELGRQEAALERHNVQEAIRAFDTVLLLEPTNREAKFYLAACLRNQTLHQPGEARELYREILEAPVHDQWTDLAEQALVDSFQWSSPQEKARWFESALGGNTNSALARFYQQNAESAARDVAIENGGQDATRLAENRLLEAIQSCQDFLDNKGGTLYGDYGLSKFQSAFPDKATAARKLAKFLPKMEAEFPKLAPHLTAEILGLQVSGNSPVVAEFRKELEWCRAHPREVFRPELFWGDSASVAFDWLFRHRHYNLAVRTMETWRAASTPTNPNDFGAEQQVTLGLAYMGAGRWRAALETFNSFSNMPVLMSTDGIWGRGWTPVLTANEADYCRQKLHLPAARDPREFEMDKTCLCLCNCSSFAVGKQGLWLASGDQLLHLSFELQTNLIVRLPKDPATPITTLDIGTAHLWIGTAGDGLIEFNKATEKCRRLTVKDGLLADAISCTHLSKDTLWIGYGTQDGGGIGFLNLGSRQCISFTPSLKEGTQAFTVTGGNTYFEPVNQPPRRPVTAIAPGKAGDIWFLTNAGALRCFRSRQNIWDGVPRVTAGSCLMVRAGRLAVGESHEAFGRTTTGPLGLDTLDLSTGRWQRFKSVPGLPSETVSALAPDGDNLWVGGMGYIALVDAAHDQVLNFTYVRARSVDKIQIGGGYVWAEYAGALHRASLQNLR